ncbi:UNKNOWN [Stylonychia lemnae]|uniref:Uncharacterized protein n=1 Tax=Stylonychia lemnae TaxID=5949 RepID=A0A078AN65_STYLE|nr:UNKNOWN [Stylonychia lemnae]|eukprot:CDW83604.1 UNKNOWN [Stylonychia lemnae]
MSRSVTPQKGTNKRSMIRDVSTTQKETSTNTGTINDGNGIGLRDLSKTGLDQYNQSFQKEDLYSQKVMSNEIMPFIIRDNRSIPTIRNPKLPSIISNRNNLLGLSNYQTVNASNYERKQTKSGYDDVKQSAIKMLNLDKANKLVILSLSINNPLQMQKSYREIMDTVRHQTKKYNLDESLENLHNDFSTSIHNQSSLEKLDSIADIQSIQSKLFKAFETQKDQVNQQLIQAKQELDLKDKELLRIKSLLISESQLFNNEQNQKELENEVLNFLQQNQMTLKQSQETKEQIREQLQNLLKETNYSGAQTTLKEVHTFLNIQKKFAIDVPVEASIVGDKRQILETNNIMLNDLANDLDVRFKDTQRQTAKKILQRFFKKNPTREIEVQTQSEEQLIENLKSQMIQKEEIIKVQREELVNQTFQIKSLDSKLNQKLVKVETLNGEIKKLNRQIEDFQEEQERLSKELQHKHNNLKDKEDDEYELKKKIDEQTDDIMRLEEMVFNFRKQLRLIATTGVIPVEQIMSEEVQPIKQLPKFNQPYHNRQFSKASQLQGVSDGSYNDEEYASESESSAYLDRKKKVNKKAEQEKVRRESIRRTKVKQNKLADSSIASERFNSSLDSRQNQYSSQAQGESMPQIHLTKYQSSMNQTQQNQALVVRIIDEKQHSFQPQTTNSISIQNQQQPNHQQNSYNKSPQQRQEVKQTVQNSSLKKDNILQKNSQPQQKFNKQAHQGKSQQPVQKQNKSQALVQETNPQNLIEQASQQQQAQVNDQFDQNKQEILIIQEHNNPDQTIIIDKQQERQNKSKQIKNRNILTNLNNSMDSILQNNNHMNFDGINNQSHDTLRERSRNVQYEAQSTFSISEMNTKTYNSRPKVILNQIRHELDLSELKLEQFLLSRKKIYIQSQKDQSTQCIQQNLKALTQKTSGTQTNITGQVHQKKQMQSQEIQVNTRELEQLEKRELLYIQNIEKLYASIKKPSMQGDSYFAAGGSFSTHSKPAHAEFNGLNEHSILRPTQDSNNKKKLSLKIQVKNAIGGGDAFTKLESDRFNRKDNSVERANKYLDHDDNFSTLKLQ